MQQTRKLIRKAVLVLLMIPSRIIYALCGIVYVALVLPFKFVIRTVQVVAAASAVLAIPALMISYIQTYGGIAAIPASGLWKQVLLSFGIAVLCAAVALLADLAIRGYDKLPAFFHAILFFPFRSREME